MRLYPLALCLLLICPATHAQQDSDMQTAPIQLAVEKIKYERAGQLVVFIFTDEHFPKQHDKAQMTFITPVRAKQAIMEIEVPTDRLFAIKVLHDQNMDQKVTKNWTGIIPKDGLGFSNNARIFLSPPSFAEASIQYHPALTPVIAIQYF